MAAAISISTTVRCDDVKDPMTRYRDASPVERRRIQAAVVQTYRPYVSRLVRSLIRDSQHWLEAEQVGAIGVLVALERDDASKALPFWPFAERFVRDEIRHWIDIGIAWRKSPNRGKSEERLANLETALVQRHMVDVADFDAFEASAPNAEEQVAQAELTSRLRAFADTLSDKDRAILFSENSQRVRSARYLALMEQARSFVKGFDENGSRPA